MTKPSQSVYESVNAFPVKSFFVSMLTRDITLEDAIVDLLDNCVDGILRKQKTSKGDQPYGGFWAKVEFESESFSISDNCGGIPWRRHEYAFRMGRVPGQDEEDARGSVGVYGVGMKRAIFKMGRKCLISTQSGRDAYEVDITPEWIQDEKNWRIPVRQSGEAMKEDGTTIEVHNLYDDISNRFGDDKQAFENVLKTMVATHYALIIDKGFSVTVNGDPVTSKPTRLVFTDGLPEKKAPAIQPFMFRQTVDGVDVFLAVGFTGPILSEHEAAREASVQRPRSIAGWTVVCNDRVVLYCNRSELTGWGEADVPRYHPQFSAISGIVEFNSDDPSKLPTTTTKRGIDASSTLYLQVKNRMRDGMKIFTTYTNRWKGLADESKKQIEEGRALSFHELKDQARELPFRHTPREPGGEQYKPDLPMPKRIQPDMRRISFVRAAGDIQPVAEYLFEDKDADPSAVGERCFDLVLGEARK